MAIGANVDRPTPKSENGRKRNSKKEERAAEGAKAISEYKAGREAERTKTERFKALRLAKEADEIAKRITPTKKRLSAT
jgi:hypothetical protein